MTASRARTFIVVVKTADFGAVGPVSNPLRGENIGSLFWAIWRVWSWEVYISCNPVRLGGKNYWCGTACWEVASPVWRYGLQDEANASSVVSTSQATSNPWIAAKCLKIRLRFIPHKWRALFEISRALYNFLFWLLLRSWNLKSGKLKKTTVEKKGFEWWKNWESFSKV